MKKKHSDLRVKERILIAMGVVQTILDVKEPFTEEERELTRTLQKLCDSILDEE